MFFEPIQMKIVRKTNHKILGLTILLCLSVFEIYGQDAVRAKKPNIVIIFLDDAGWGDFEPFDKSITYTPNMQQLSGESKVFSNFYVPQAVCSASRAALLTGCYPGRTKMFGAIAPREPGLSTDFKTMGEIFKAEGYKTALFGKWHLGDVDGERPWDRGFDETAGLLYSHDMWKYHPEEPEVWGKYPLQFWENGKVLIPDMEPADQKTLTRRYTQYAVDFIHHNKDNPFLLYVPHNMPHVPIYASDNFAGKSGMGLYGDVVMELDWSIGRINQTLKDEGLEDNTILIVTTDNGPWIVYGNHAGKTPFREGKTTSFDGGVKSGMLIKYPKMIKGGSFSEATLCSIDILPTLAELAGIKLDTEKIDGKSMVGLLGKDEAFKNPQQYYAISNLKELQSMISGDGEWKLHVEHPYRTLIKEGADRMPGSYENKILEASLFNLKKDPFERFNLIREQPEIAKRLMMYYKEHFKKFYGKQH